MHLEKMSACRQPLLVTCSSLGSPPSSRPCPPRNSYILKNVECVEQPRQVEIGVIIGPVLAGVFVLIIAAALLASWYEREMWGKGWRIEMRALDTTDCQVLGQGSNGYVVSASYRGTRVALKRGLPPDITDQSNAPLLGEKGRRIVRMARKEREKSSRDASGEKGRGGHDAGSNRGTGTRSGRGRLALTDGLPTIEESAHTASSRGTTDHSSSIKHFAGAGLGGPEARFSERAAQPCTVRALQTVHHILHHSFPVAADML